MGRKRQRHSAAFKAKVALAAVQERTTVQIGESSSACIRR